MKLSKPLLIAGMVVGLSCTAQADDTKKFSGLYLGGQVGYVDVGPTDGFGFGGYFGGRYQTDSNLVFGAELDLVGTRAGDGVGVFSLLGTVGVATGQQKDTLFYLGGGLASGLGLDDIPGFNLLGTDDGFTIVGGVERALKGGWRWRLQGKYVDFTSDGADPDVESNATGLSVTTGISYQF